MKNKFLILLFAALFAFCSFGAFAAEDPCNPTPPEPPDPDPGQHQREWILMKDAA